MALTDTAVRNAKPGLKPGKDKNEKPIPVDGPYKLFDERGLFLLVTPSGGKWWRLRYKFDGKEKLLSLGVYPDVSLASQTKKDEETGKTQKIKGARELRDEARELIAQGIDPGENRKARKRQRRNGPRTALKL
jgi:hypothetical protein